MQKPAFQDPQSPVYKYSSSLFRSCIHIANRAESEVNNVEFAKPTYIHAQTRHSHHHLQQGSIVGKINNQRTYDANSISSIGKGVKTFPSTGDLYIDCGGVVCRNKLFSRFVFRKQWLQVCRYDVRWGSSSAIHVIYIHLVSKVL